MNHVGGSWTVGTQDGDTVYLERWTGEEPDKGLQIFRAHTSPNEARNIGQALIDKANAIDPR